MRHAEHYDQPFFWFGPRLQPPARDIAALLRDGTIGTPEAAFLWASLARGQSLTVVAQESGVGKTTLLTALLAFCRRQHGASTYAGAMRPSRSSTTRVSSPRAPRSSSMN